MEMGLPHYAPPGDWIAHAACLKSELTPSDFLRSRAIGARLIAAYVSKSIT